MKAPPVEETGDLSPSLVIFLGILSIFVVVVVVGTIQHIKLRRATGEQILAEAEEKL